MKYMRLREEDTRRGPLILVTPDHALTEEGRPEAVSAVRYGDIWQEHMFLSGQIDHTENKHFPILLEQEAAEQLSGLLEKLGSGSRILPVSGLRSREEQVQIWNETMEKEGEVFTRTFVAKPGHSEHESGLAVDLAENRNEIDFICPEFPKEGICGEFRRLAPLYGFVERYPEEKRSVTGIGGEPWHFRYVGASHGGVMEREGMILEEYIAFLKRYTSAEDPYVWRDAQKGVCTEIFYVDLQGKEEQTFVFSVQEEIRYSGTNEGGIVICRRRRHV